jgi:hypothetical protein
MAIISGPRGSANVNQTLRKPDIADKIYLLQPDASPLTVLTRNLRKQVTINPKYDWPEDDLDTRFAATSTTYTNSATSIVVAAGQGVYFAQHDLVKVPRTGEVFRVTAVATDTLTVVRGVGSGGTGVAMNSAEELLILGSAQPEGDTSKPARSGTATVQTNYTQIFRRPIEFTETYRNSQTWTGMGDWAYQKGKVGIEHRKDIEETFLFGKSSEDTTGSQPRRTTGGALSYITTNVTAAGGTLSEASFFGALRSAFRYGSGTKWGFASGLAVDVLNGYARSKVQIPEAGRDTYGLNVVRYQSPHGTINLIRHWLLEGATYGGYLLILDAESVAYRYLQNRDSHVLEEIQAPDSDTRKDEWLGEVGFQLINEKQSALITGITG